MARLGQGLVERGGGREVGLSPRDPPRDRLLLIRPYRRGTVVCAFMKICQTLSLSLSHPRALSHSLALYFASDVYSQSAQATTIYTSLARGSDVQYAKA